MNWMKRILAILLSFIMIFTYMPIGDMLALAEGEERIISITSISPDKVSVGNGKVVEIIGTGFGTKKSDIQAYIRYDDGTKVDILEKDIDPPGNNKISIYIPPSGEKYTGEARVIINRTGWGSDSIAFQYIDDPEITRVITNTEITIQRDKDGNIIIEDGKPKKEKKTYIEIYGYNFNLPGQQDNIENPVELKGDGKTLSAEVLYQNDGYIKTEIPENFNYNKEYSITVSNKFGGSYTFPSDTTTREINLAEHDITQLSNLKVNIEGDLIIYGTKLPTDSEVEVYIGDERGEQEAKIVPENSNESQIKITVPQVSTNDYQNVKVVNTKTNTAVTLVDELLVSPKPTSFTVTSVSPNAGTKEGGTLVRIRGTNLNSNMQIKFGDEYATGVELDEEMTTEEETVLKAITPSCDNTGTVDVIVINPLDNGQAVLPNGYRYTEVENSLVVGKVNPNWDYEIGGKIVSIPGRNFQMIKEGEDGNIISDEESVEPVGEDNKAIAFIKGENGNLMYRYPNTGKEVKVIRKRTLRVYFGGAPADIQLIDSKDLDSKEIISPEDITKIDSEYGTQTIRVKAPQITLKPREDTPVDVTVEIVTEYIGEDNAIIDQYTEKEVAADKFTYKPAPSSPKLEVVHKEKDNTIPSIDENVTMAKGPQGSIVYIYGLDFRPDAKVYFFKEDDKPLNELLIPKNEGEVLEIIDLEGLVDNKLISRIEVKVPNINALGSVTVVVQNPDGARTKTLAEFKEDNPFGDDQDENQNVQNRITARQFEYLSTPIIDGVSPEYGSTSYIDDKGDMVERHPIVVINGKNFLINSYIDENQNTIVEKPMIYVVPDSVDTEEITSGLNQATYDKYKAELKEVVLEKDKKLINPDGVKEKLGTKMVVKMPSIVPENEGYRDIIVINPDGGYTRYKNGFEYKNPKTRPEIFEINPDRGSVDGGEKVQIIGKDFEYSIKEILLMVTIDGELAKVKKIDRTTYNGENAQIITIVTPKGTEGTKTVQVINSDGGTAEGKYIYTEVNTIPIITTIAPDKGGPHTVVLIKGDDFVLPNPKSSDEDEKIGTKVFFNGDEMATKIKPDIVSEGVYVLNRQTIRVVLPDNLPLGMKDVKVLNPDTAFFVVEDGFEYLNPQDYPEISNISPEQGSRDGGTIVTIKGSNFKEGIEVYFGEKRGINPKVNGDGTEITVTTPKYEIDEKITDRAAVLVTVVNYDGGSDTRRDGFTFRVPGSFPKIKKIDPNKGSTAGNEIITIEGEDFRYEDENGDNRWNEREPTAKVYFNGVKALNVRYVSDVELIVTTPPYLEGGKVDVVIINPDAGTAVAKGGFTYEKSKPVIGSITPDTLAKIGGEEITILGAGFIKGLDAEAGKDIDIEVIFGEEHNSDSISGSHAITNIGKLQVEYDNTDPDAECNVFVRLDEEEKASFKMNLGESKIILLATSEKEAEEDEGTENEEIENKNEEGIKIDLRDKKLTVTRRLSPKVDYIDENTIIATTPPMDKIGEKAVSLVNRDGGTGKGIIIIKNPNSHPVITDIQPKLPKNIKGSELLEYYIVESTIDGDITFTIKGEDFRKGVRVMIGSQEAEVLSRSNNDDVIVVKSPKGKEEDVNKLLRIIVENEDGKNAYSSKSQIGSEEKGEEKGPAFYVYRSKESNPVIDSIEPNKGSIKGGDKVVIKGNDFRIGKKGEDIAIRFGSENVTELVYDECSYDKLVFITPPGDVLGSVDVMVRNNRALGEVILPDGFTYYSNPTITRVEPRDIHNIGGQTIKVEGTMFMEGIKVYIDEVEGKDVKLIDEKTLEFISPPGELGEKILKVENTDGGWAEIEVTYILPIPEGPTGFTASPGHERSIVLKWDDTLGASRYKIFGRRSRKGDYKFIAETTELEYYIKDLEPDTKYYFKLWAINEYGESVDYDYAHATTLKSKKDDGDDKYDQEKIKDTVTRYADGGVFIDLPSKYDGGEYNIDITDLVYKDYDKIQVNVPISAVKKERGVVSVIGRDITFCISMYQLRWSTYYLNTGKSDDANIIVTISKLDKTDKTRLTKSLSKKEKAITDVFKVNITLQKERDTEDIELKEGINIGLIVDDDKLKEEDMHMYKFNPEENKLETIGSYVKKAIDYTKTKFVYHVYTSIKGKSKILVTGDKE